MAAAALCLLLETPVEAMTVMPQGQGDSAVVLVEGGCGPGGHRDRYGNCRPNFRPPYRRPCPPRMFLDRFGHCRY